MDAVWRVDGEVACKCFDEQRLRSRGGQDAPSLARAGWDCEGEVFEEWDGGRVGWVQAVEGCVF